jgi:hypothetical protein
MNVEVLNTNPPQVCVTYPDGRMVVMYKADWDKQNS